MDKNKLQSDTLLKADVKKFTEMWYSRNPSHENNADTGEDMFWATAELVAREYIAEKKLNINNNEIERLQKENRELKLALNLVDLYKQKQMQTLLKEYEEWEAMLIADNAMWWPYAEKDAISGKTYDKMLELQAKRNEILNIQSAPVAQ